MASILANSSAVGLSKLFTGSSNEFRIFRFHEFFYTYFSSSYVNIQFWICESYFFSPQKQVYIFCSVNMNKKLICVGKIMIRRFRIGCRHLMNKIFKSLMFLGFFRQTNHSEDWLENWLENFLKTYFGICCLIRWTVYSSCSCIISNDEAVYFLFAFFLRLTHFFRMRRWFDRKN